LDVYIHWYNDERISIKLKGLSPVQYQAQALAA
ncbi:IS3 family transposase, partial [Mycobacterium sp. ACS1612]